VIPIYAGILTGLTGILTAAQPSGIPEAPDLPERPGIIVIVGVDSYSVDGRRFRHAVEAIEAARPYSPPSETQFGINYGYGAAEVEAGCLATGLELTVTLDQVYPRWSGYGEASGMSQRRWDELLQQRRDHETGHARLAVHAAELIHADLGDLGVQPDCDQLQSRVDGALRAALSRLNRWQNRYDSATGNGDRQSGFDIDDYIASLD